MLSYSAVPTTSTQESIDGEARIALGDEGPSGEVDPVPSRTDPPHPRLEGPLLARLAWGASKKERLGARGANWWSHVGDAERRAVDGTSIGGFKDTPSKQHAWWVGWVGGSCRGGWE